MPADSCKDGLANYLIYYKNRLDDSMQLLVTLSPNDTMYEHFPEITLAACYIVSAIDSAGNISECSNNTQCVDICSYYELPNIFTPNSDNINDLYHPLPYKFVQSIDLKIYNRWGNLVFETTDPDINWNGNDISTGKLVSDGVYYYICDVFEERLSGVVPRNISGFIHIYRNSKNSKP
jgi:gliding motility-associated-like protein